MARGGKLGLGVGHHQSRSDGCSTMLLVTDLLAAVRHKPPHFGASLLFGGF